MLKNVSIDYDNFKEIIEDLIKNSNKVALFSRPRRFGKSLFVSMLDNSLI